jgi:DUF1009 family protein
MSDAAVAASDSPLGIVCGAGSVPFAVADAVRRRGRPVMLFPLIGWADGAAAARHPHQWVHLGQFGRLCRVAQAAGCRDLVFIGTLIRPSLWHCRLDWGTLRVLPSILRAFRGGDDHLLSGIGRMFEDAGFRLVGAHEVAPEILVPEGPLGRRTPGARDLADIKVGLAALAAIGPFDVGQAAIVADGHVLALEDIEGTDGLLARVADLRRRKRIRIPPGIGVLVKAPKPMQDHRFDLPAIGPQTIEGVAHAELAGIAIVAGGAIIAEPDSVAKRADAANIFVTGIRPGETP